MPPRELINENLLVTNIILDTNMILNTETIFLNNCFSQQISYRNWETGSKFHHAQGSAHVRYVSVHYTIPELG